MRNYRKKRLLKVDINVVPLLDVLLVLLLICIATTPIVTKNIEVTLPDINNKEEISTIISNPQIVVEVAGTPSYALVTDEGRKENLSTEDLITAIKYQFQLNAKTVVLIGGKKEIPYQEVIKIFDVLSQAGIHSVGLMTKTLSS